VQVDLTECVGKRICKIPAFSLYGLTKVAGFVVDLKNQDIVLLGAAAPNAPPLFVDDFAIALRALSLKYARLEGDKRVYSFPGISIDPIPETMRRMTENLREIDASRSP
jgi:hypothetical protein